MNDKNNSNINISGEQKSAIAEGIIWGTLTIMKRTIERESPKQCAAHDSKSFKQSKTATAKNTIAINILTNEQKLPARPRDIRTVLADEEKNIGNAELSDTLSSICRRLILKHSENKFSNPRGRPISESGPNNETRGRKSYYDRSIVKQILDHVLDDPEYYKKIENAINNSDIYFKHRKFSIEVALHQLKHKKEFLNTYRPILNKYGLKEISSDTAYLKKNITDELIERIASDLAHNTKPTLEEKRAIYTQGGVIYLDQIMSKYRPAT